MVNAESGRLLFALNDAADETARRLCAEAGRQESEMAGREAALCRVAGLLDAVVA